MAHPNFPRFNAPPVAYLTIDKRKRAGLIGDWLNIKDWTILLQLLAFDIILIFLFLGMSGCDDNDDDGEKGEGYLWKVKQNWPAGSCFLKPELLSAAISCWLRRAGVVQGVQRVQNRGGGSPKNMYWAKLFRNCSKTVNHFLTFLALFWYY